MKLATLPRRMLEWLAPNAVLGACLLLGLVLEIILLCRVPDNLYNDGGRVAVLGTGYVLWFWWTATWLFWGALRGLNRLTDRGGRPVGWPLKAVSLVLTSVLILAYLASWALYFRSGRFTNIEGVIFGIENAQTGWFWEYLKQSESRYFLVLAAGLCFVAICIPFVAWLSQRAARKYSSGLIRCTRVASWVGLSLALLYLPGTVIAKDEKLMRHRRDAMLDTLKNRTHPFVTLASSLVDLWHEEPIEPCIDVAELKSLRTPYAAALPEGKRYSVIFVAVESLRPDVIGKVHQGTEITPHLNLLAKNGLQCSRAYSQSTHSDYADVCIVSSLYPLRTRRHHYYRASDPWPKTCIYDVLKPFGYATAIISSQNERWGSMDRFLDTPNLDWFYDAERSDVPDIKDERDHGMQMALEAKEVRRGKLADRHTTETALTWIERQTERGKPFFLSLNLQSSHFPYTLPPGVPEPFQPCEMDFDASFLHYPPEKTDIVRNAYYNAIHECDRQVGRLVATLRRLNQLDNTILVVLGENGEAFHENGSVTHAREPVEPALRVACVFHAPKLLTPRQEDYPIELIDIVPTVFGLLGLPQHDNFQGIDFLAAQRPPDESRLLFFHVENGLSRADAVLLGGRWKLHLDRNRKRLQLFDVQEDPGETTDLSEAQPELTKRLFETLLTWRRRQLAYYHFPHYHDEYYPPKPPTWAPGR